MSIPKELLYTEDHEWARVEGQLVTVGITAHAAEQLGDIVFVELPDVDTQLDKGDTFGVVESTKAVSDLFIPVSGRVAEVNEPLVDDPGAINADPYENAWLVKMEISDEAELESLLSAEAYEKFIAESE